MTYDTQGRRVLQGHPSTWPQEVEQLRALLEECSKEIFESAKEAADRGATDMFCRRSDLYHKIRAALQKQEATTAPHSATHSAKSDPAKGTTPEKP